jgi:hypothetical protein
MGKATMLEAVDLESMQKMSSQPSKPSAPNLSRQLTHPRCLSTNPWTCCRTSFSSCPTPSTSSYSTSSPFARQSSLSILIVSIRFILGVLPSFATGLHVSSNPTIRCVGVPPRLGISISWPNTVDVSDMPRGHGSVDDKGVAVPGAPADRNETLEGCR